MADLTSEQIALARHALGLTKRQKVSYRNSFVAGRDHPDYGDWADMVRTGMAIRISGRRLSFGGDDLFHLTRRGAEAALKPGERLRPEDFPGVLAGRTETC